MALILSAHLASDLTRKRLTVAQTEVTVDRARARVPDLRRPGVSLSFRAFPEFGCAPAAGD
jgi:hypothetical protein